MNQAATGTQNHCEQREVLRSLAPSANDSWKGSLHGDTPVTTLSQCSTRARCTGY